MDPKIRIRTKMSWIRNTADSDSPKSLKVPIFVLKNLLKVAYDPENNLKKGGRSSQSTDDR
jgi:hypothetical protein